MKVIPTTLSAVLVVLTISGLALAQGAAPRDGRQGHDGSDRMQRGMNGGSHGAGAGHMEMLFGRMAENPELREKLGITDEQIQALRNKSFEFRKKQVDLRAELEKAGMDQARLMMEDDPDEDAIMAAVEKAGATKTALAKLQVRQMLLVKKTLTPDQVAAIREIMHERMKKRPGGQDRKKFPRSQDAARPPRDTQ